MKKIFNATPVINRMRRDGTFEIAFCVDGLITRYFGTSLEEAQTRAGTYVPPKPRKYYPCPNPDAQKQPRA